MFVGEPGREPLSPPFMMAAEQSGLAAAVAVLAMLRRPGRAARVDIAEYEVLATNHMTGLSQLVVSSGSCAAARRTPQANPYPFTILPCRDGEVCVAFLSGHQWRHFVETMGDPEPGLPRKVFRSPPDGRALCRRVGYLGFDMAA